MATGEHYDVVGRYYLVQEGVWKPMQQRAAHIARCAHRSEHLRVEPEECEGGIHFRDERTPEAGYLAFVLATRLANLRAGLGAK